MIKRHTVHPSGYPKDRSRIGESNGKVNQQAKQEWNRDELILALDLYFRARPKNLDDTDPRVIALSKTLNGLPSSRSAIDSAKFRNPNGVAMKCGNLKRFDPHFINRGRKGLSKSNRLEEVVWNDFASDPARLFAVAEAIRMGAAEASTGSKGIATTETQIAPEEEFQEGAVLTRLHKRRERDPKASAKKKVAVLQETGRLQCEACEFDFADAYGDLGIGFAGCQHRLPLASLGSRTGTRLRDLAILGANCHRMIHKTRPPMSVEEFKRVVVADPSHRKS